MMTEKNGWQKQYAIITLAAVCALAIFACLYLYQYDNKYTVSGPQAAHGVVFLDKQTLTDCPVMFLVEGWEYYGGRLLSPEDFTNDPPAPDEYIFIGQYGGFDTDNFTDSPHGSASYRLLIDLPEKAEAYMLELPEIFSSYRVYLNGELAGEMGNPAPDNYQAETGNRAVSVKASGRLEILVAVSDFSHIYSGMVYPPAFGEPEAVSALLSARLVFRSVLTASALVIGALSLLIGLLSKKNRLAVLFGLLCLFFVGFTCYPIIQTLARGSAFVYATENVSFCAMLLTVMLLQSALYGKRGKLSRVFICFGGFMCLTSAVMPYLLPNGSLLLMGVYSYGVMAYEWLTAIFLTVTAARAVWRGTLHSKVLMSGILAFDTALIMDRLLPLHEPIVTGWFTELASFALVLCVGVVVGAEVAAKYRDSAVLEERANSMERLSEIQRSNYDLLMGRIEETKTAQHDLRHHMVMIEGLVQGKEYDRLETYVGEFQSAIRRVQPVGYSQNIVVGVLAKHYVQLAEKNEIDLKVKLDIGRDARVSDADLCALLSNLLENALDACQRQTDGERFIHLSIGQTPSAISIRVENSTDGNIAERGGVFVSSKGGVRKGYGLESIQAAARRYGGDAEFCYDNDKKVFVSTVLLMLNG